MSNNYMEFINSKSTNEEHHEKELFGIFSYLRGHYADIKIREAKYKNYTEHKVSRISNKIRRANKANEDYRSIHQIDLSAEKLTGVITEPENFHIK